jgi:hypothetical protein
MRREDIRRSIGTRLREKACVTEFVWSGHSCPLGFEELSASGQECLLHTGQTWFRWELDEHC